MTPFEWVVYGVFVGVILALALAWILWSRPRHKARHLTGDRSWDSIVDAGITQRKKWRP